MQDYILEYMFGIVFSASASSGGVASSLLLFISIKDFISMNPVSILARASKTLFNYDEVYDRFNDDIIFIIYIHVCVSYMCVCLCVYRELPL